MNFDDWDSPLSSVEQNEKGNPYIDSPECGLDLFSRIFCSRQRKESNPAYQLRKQVTQLFQLLKRVRMRDALVHYRRFLSLCDRATALEKCRLLRGKTVVGFGGQFSSGKSSFINSVSGLGDILPAEQDPTTSIPTFVVASNQERRTAHTVQGGTVELDFDAVEALSHAFHKKYEIGFAPFLDSIIVETSKFALDKRIALLDTPGYTKPENETAVIGIISDRRRAQEQLRAADYLIWVADITEGTLHPEDMDFIDDLQLKTQFLLVYNKADLKTASDRELIIRDTKKTIRKMTTKCFGVVAYSSSEKKEYTEHIISKFMEHVASSQVQSNDLKSLFLQTEKSLRRALNDVQDELKNETANLWRLLQGTYSPDKVGSLASLWSQRNRSVMHLRGTYSSVDKYLEDLNKAIDLLLNWNDNSKKNIRKANSCKTEQTTITAKDIMSILAKVMKVANAEHTDLWDGYRKLSEFIQKDLSDALNASLFPQAPEANERLSDMLERLEAMCVCNEIHSHPVVLFASTGTSNLFFHLRNVLFNGRPPKELYSNFTTLPFIVIHGSKPSIQAINYSNARIDLDKKTEYTTLIQGCRISNINLQKIIKFFIVTMPLQRPDERYLFDNDYGLLLRLFHPTILQKIYVLDAKSPKRSKYDYDILIAPNAGVTQGSISIEEFTKSSFPLQKVPVYGFRDEYASIENWVAGYFTDFVFATEEMTRQLTDDVIRIDNRDRELVVLRDQMTRQEAELKEVWQALRPKLKDVRDDISYCESQLEIGVEFVERFASRKILDWVFITLFDTQELFCDSSAVRTTTLERLGELKYDALDLVECYISNINGNKYALPRGYKNYIPKREEWEKAKMLLELCNPDCIDPIILKKWLDVLRWRCVSGKIFYLNARIETTPAERGRLLHNAFERGYLDAAKLILVPNDKCSLDYLARGLYPQACLARGSQIVEESKIKFGDRFFPTITSYYLTYYKLAVSQGYLYGAKAIVDLLYEYTFPVPKLLDRFSEISLKDKNARVILWLSQKLIEGGLDAEHYREIQGVTLFCLGRKAEGDGYVQSWKILRSLKLETYISKYCKAYMLAHGQGVSQNLEEALALLHQIPKNFSNVAGLAHDLFVELVNREINFIQCQQIRDMEEQEVSYQKDNNYSSHSTYTGGGSYSSGSTTMVFIVSLGLAYQSEELKFMRTFRDTQFGRTETGRQLIQEYYRIGPMLNKAIASLDNPKSEYDRLWKEYVQKAFESIQRGDVKTGQDRIIAMQLDLCNKYNVKYNNKLVTEFLLECSNSKSLT